MCEENTNTKPEQSGGNEVTLSARLPDENPEWRFQRADGEVKILDMSWKTVATVQMAEWICPESGEIYEDEKQTEINAVLIAQAPKMKAQLNTIAKSIHYPECWDTMAYTTLESAIHEIGCNIHS